MAQPRTSFTKLPSIALRSFVLRSPAQTCTRTRLLSHSAQARPAARVVRPPKYAVRQERLVSASSTAAASRRTLSQGSLFSEGPSGSECVIHPILLRKACTCPHCINPSDKQFNYSSADIPLDIAVDTWKQDAAGNYSVTWKNDLPGYQDHVSTFSADQVRSWGAAEVPKRVSPSPPKFLWDKDSFPLDASTFPYHDFVGSAQGRAKVVYQLWRTGLVFITHMPTDEKAVEHLAAQLGPLYNSFYGLTWDVRSVPGAKNVAYTHRFLGFHMDLLYMHEPPQYQLLHCLENTCTGGESQFADTFKVLDRMAASPEGQRHLQTLQLTPQRYGYFNDGHHYTRNRATVSSSPFPQPCENADHPAALSHLDRVYWSPPFEYPAPSDLEQDIEANTAARHFFSHLLNSDQAIVETKLTAGTCTIFNNLRVVHARRAFDVNSGKRWLKGAYVAGQDFNSTFASLRDLMPS
ncbi:hypothetical protein DV737_g4769, partial [Chaetothyriales sp. CBS 132003]